VAKPEHATAPGKQDVMTIEALISAYRKEIQESACCGQLMVTLLKHCHPRENRSSASQILLKHKLFNKEMFKLTEKSPSYKPCCLEK
jgi:hypothetical protein